MRETTKCVNQWMNSLFLFTDTHAQQKSLCVCGGRECKLPKSAGLSSIVNLDYPLANKNANQKNKWETIFLFETKITKIKREDEF